MNTLTINKEETTYNDIAFPVHTEVVRGVSELILPNHKMTVNSRTGQPLGVVGLDYKVVTNEELFGTMLDSLNKLGLEHTETYRDHGARSYMDISLPSINYNRPAKIGDITECRLTLQNSFDGSLRAGIKLAAQRLWCTNGCTSGEDMAKVMKKHTSDINVGIMVNAVESQIEGFQTMVEMWSAMAAYEVKPQTAVNLINRFAPTNKMKKANKRIKASAIFPEKYREDVQNIYRRPLSAGDYRDANLLSVYDSFTETATHVIGEDVSAKRLGEYNDSIYHAFAGMVSN